MRSRLLEDFKHTIPRIIESRDHPLLQISAFSSSCLTEVLRLLINTSPFPLPALLTTTAVFDLTVLYASYEWKETCNAHPPVSLSIVSSCWPQRKASHQSTPILLSAGPTMGPHPKSCSPAPLSSNRSLITVGFCDSCRHWGWCVFPTAIVFSNKVSPHWSLDLFLFDNVTHILLIVSRRRI